MAQSSSQGRGGTRGAPGRKVAKATALSPGTAAAAPGHPFEAEGGFVSQGPLDGRVLVALRRRGIIPANPCSDEVFVRRAYLDVIGTLPTAAEVRQFLQDKRAGKRASLIDTLLQREEFADYWSLKWCDLLRVKAEFPINLWPNAVQAYHHWIRQALRDNLPYDRFVRELLTSSGSNFRVGPVNFYRAIQGREPSAIAEAVALTFMGVRLETWPAERRAGLARFFSRIAYKTTAEWKEEIVCLDPAPTAPTEGVLPDGSQVLIGPQEDPRDVFSHWLIQPTNPWFTRNIANRVWSWLLGRGIIHEPDDIRPDNPPSNADLLAYLEQELAGARYDLRHLYRVILNSATYQQSSIPRSRHPEAEAMFAYYPVRRLDAEVLVDALNGLFGSGESYSSMIPEPFTFIPEEQRSIELADGSITSQFLEMFGRPARDTGLEAERSNQPTDAQRLHLLNSTHVQAKIEQSWRLRQLAAGAKGNRDLLVNLLYMHILSREPTGGELAAAKDYFQAAGLGEKQATDDLAWALVNTKEFLYRH